MGAAEGTLETYVTKTNAIDGSLTSLGTRMNAVEKRFTSYVLTDTFNGTVGDINVTLNRHWSAIEQTDKNLLLSINKSTGYPLNKDVKFVKGMNGISRYNNSGGEAVTAKRLEIHSGSSVPSGSNAPAAGWTTDAIRAAHVATFITILPPAHGTLILHPTPGRQRHPNSGLFRQNRQPLSAFKK